MNAPSDSPLVSVIVTSYNYARFVGECLASVRAQTYGAFELIVVDDGSTDNSADIIGEALKDFTGRSEFIQQPNGGQASALNAAFERCEGAIVAPLDSDDYWLPEKLERIVAFMEMVPGGGVYQHQLDTGSGPKRAGLVSGDVFEVWKRWDGGVFNIADAFDGISFSPFVPTSGLAFRREVLDKVFPIPEAITTCADAYLTRTATAYGPLVSLPETLGVWRDHGENAGHDPENDFEGFWKPVILPALNRFYDEHGLGLRLEFEPGQRSSVPVSRLFGEQTPATGEGTPREQLTKGRSRQSQLLRDLLKSAIGR